MLNHREKMSTHLKPCYIILNHVRPCHLMFNPCFFLTFQCPSETAIAFPSSAPPQVDDFLGDGTFGRVLLARDTNRERNRGEAATAGGLREKWGQFMDVFMIGCDF